MGVIALNSFPNLKNTATAAAVTTGNQGFQSLIEKTTGLW